MAIIKNVNNKFRENVDKLSWWKCKMVQALWKAVWWLLKKVNIELSYDSAIPLLGIYPGELKTYV